MSPKESSLAIDEKLELMDEEIVIESPLSLVFGKRNSESSFANMRDVVSFSGRITVSF